VISFYHSDTVRITQVCWNGEHNPITFRQSRLLDIASDSFDTPDLFLLTRWMQCLPLREPKVSRRQADDSRSACSGPEPRPPSNSRPARGCRQCRCPGQACNADADVDADTGKTRQYQ
jgi:hypothetical protein